MHAIFTSGAARRRDLRSIEGYPPLPSKIIAVNAEHDRRGRTNPILDLFRDDTYTGDPDLHYHATQFLFQLARVWSEWQSARIGTFPLEYRDYAGPVDREYSEESGEDREYWEITDVISDFQMDWRLRGHSTIETGNRIQDFIVHAVAVLDRIYDITNEED